MKIFNFTAACERSFIALLTLACLSTLSCPQASAQAESIALGKGKYFTQPRGSDKAPPSGPNRSGMMLERAVPTNQWYSSLVFKAESEALFAHPLSVKPTARGFELAYPQKQIVPTPRLDVEVHYPHANPLVFQPTHFKTARSTLDKASDWAIDIASGDEGKLLKATVAHGSPLVSFTLTEGNVDLFLPAEASSNLSRFDGVKFGHRAKDYTDLVDMYKKTRAEGFGEEVKRRIMTGAYVLSHGYYDAYYLQAQKIRRMISDDFQQAFKLCDVIAGPVAPTVAWKLGEKADDPVANYLADIFTLPASLAGLPGMSVPAGFGEEAMPVGLQLIGNYFKEAQLLNAAHRLQQATDFHLRQPGGAK